MLSERVKSIVYYCTLICGYTGGSAMICDRSSFTFQINSKLITLVKRNFFLGTVWGTLSLALIYLRANDKENCLMTSAYCLGYFTVLITYSYHTFFGVEICVTTTKFIYLMNHLQGTYKIRYYLTIYVVVVGLNCLFKVCLYLQKLACQNPLYTHQKVCYCTLIC